MGLFTTLFVLDALMDTENNEEEIRRLKRENEKLRKQIDKTSQRLTALERGTSYNKRIWDRD